jgi:virginiamycin A acetyltransferase
VKIELIIKGVFLRQIVRFIGFYSKAKSIYIQRGSVIHSRTSIGIGSRINGKIKVRGQGRLKIGRYCALGDDIKVITQNHDTSCPVHSLNLQRKIYGKSFVVPRDVDIGDNVWVGDSAIFLPGSNVGNNSIVAAGAVVAGRFGDCVVLAGVPAKIIKTADSPLSEGFWGKSVEEMQREIKSLEIRNAKL